MQTEQTLAPGALPATAAEDRADEEVSTTPSALLPPSPAVLAGAIINGLLVRVPPLCPCTSGAAGPGKLSPVTSNLLTRLCPALGRTVSGVIPMEDRCHFRSFFVEPVIVRKNQNTLC